MSIIDVNRLQDDDRDFRPHTCLILVLVERADRVAVQPWFSQLCRDSVQKTSCEKFRGCAVHRMHQQAMNFGVARASAGEWPV
jgi:hypothetical protein